MYINTHTCIHVHVVWIQYKKHYYSLSMTSKLGSDDFICNIHKMYTCTYVVYSLMS